jgi:hypothetical protein
MRRQIFELTATVHGFLSDLGGVHINSFLAEWPAAGTPTRSIVPNNLPVLSWMPETVAAAPKKALFLGDMLASVADQIAWGQTYAVADFGSGFLEKYGWTELIGLRGPIASERIACGFLMLGPEIEYPRHSHDAEEVYVPLTEPTLWMQGKENWVLRESCRPIYHPSRMPHAMRTASTPLLALYLWRGGNLTEKSRIE